MDPAIVYRRRFTWAAAVVLALFPAQAWADKPLGGMKVEKILFLGNSITLHPPLPERKWTGNWGMAASALEKDFVHVLTSQIDAQTGGSLKLTLVDPTKKNADGAVSLNDANVVNIAEILERKYASYEPELLRSQIAARPDVVVLQFGENVRMDSFDAAAFTKSLKKLVSDLKESNNPTIFVTSQIYGPNEALDRVKQQVVAEDPGHRVFVDLSGFGKDPSYNGFLSHPNDQGMKFIADTIFKAMRSHQPPVETKSAN
jgi:lysophospholipase L1-like esterase